MQSSYIAALKVIYLFLTKWDLSNHEQEQSKAAFLFNHEDNEEEDALKGPVFHVFCSHLHAFITRADNQIAQM